MSLQEAAARHRLVSSGQFVVASEGKSARSSLCQRPIWCRVRRPALFRLLVVASGGRSWSCKKATRRVRKLLAIASSRREVTHRRRRLVVAQCFRLLIAASEGSSPLESLSAQQRTLVVASSKGDSPSLQQRATRRRCRELLVATAESAQPPRRFREGIAINDWRACRRSRELVLAVTVAAAESHSIRERVAVGELVDAAESSSLLRQRARRRWRARRRGLGAASGGV